MENIVSCPICGSKARKRNDSSSYRCMNKKCMKTFRLNTPNQVLKNVVKINNLQNSMGVSIDEFRAKNDVKYIIKKGLVKLKKDILYKTSDLVVILGLPGNIGSNKLLDMEETEGYHGKCSSGIYWSHPETIQQLKKETVLR